jgi:hypothetical protein
VTPILELNAADVLEVNYSCLHVVTVIVLDSTLPNQIKWEIRGDSQILNPSFKIMKVARACLDTKNFAKVFNISRHIESLDACMKH